MVDKRIRKIAWTITGAVLLLGLGTIAMAADGVTASSGGIGTVAATARGNLSDIAKLLTAGSYVAGMAFGIGAIVKFKAHKDAPTQVHLGQAIALLFLGGALMFIPSVFKTSGGTLFGTGGKQAGIGGVSSFS